MVSMMNQSVKVKEVSTFSFSWSSEALHFYVLHLRAIFQTKIKHFQIKHLRLNWLRCSHLTNKKLNFYGNNVAAYCFANSLFVNLIFRVKVFF